MIPKEHTVTEYQTVERSEVIPREKKVTDYYTVEHVTDYIPNVV